VSPVAPTAIEIRRDVEWCAEWDGGAGLLVSQLDGIFHVLNQNYSQKEPEYGWLSHGEQVSIVS